MACCWEKRGKAHLILGCGSRKKEDFHKQEIQTEGKKKNRGEMSSQRLLLLVLQAISTRTCLCDCPSNRFSHWPGTSLSSLLVTTVSKQESSVTSVFPQCLWALGPNYLHSLLLGTLQFLNVFFELQCLKARVGIPYEASTVPNKGRWKLPFVCWFCFS